MSHTTKDTLEMSIYITGKMPLYMIFNKIDNNYKSIILDICIHPLISSLNYGIKSCFRQLLRTHLWSTSKLLNFKINKNSEYDNCLIYIWKYLNTIPYRIIQGKEIINITTFEDFKEFINKAHILNDKDLQIVYPAEIYIQIIDNIIPLNKLIIILSQEVEFKILCMLEKEIINENYNPDYNIVNKDNILQYIHKSEYIKDMKLLVNRLEHLLMILKVDITKVDIGLPYSKNTLLHLLNKKDISYFSIDNTNMFVKRFL